MESEIIPSEQGKGRKRIADKSKWKREIAKRERHAAECLPLYPTCNHDGKTYKCRKLSPRNIYNFHRNFYSTTEKVVQDAYILKYCRSSKPRRNRQKKNGSSRKTVTTNYFVKKAGCQLFEVQVCQKTFLNILHISKDRVQRITRSHLNSGLMPRENRGGDRVSSRYDEKRRAVRKFIENLTGIESHYCRSKSHGRQYLPSGLSISKLWRFYDESTETTLRVKRSFFRDIFTKNYNIGFGSPITDACSKCIELSEKIKSEKNNNIKNDLIIGKRVHKLRANAFFKKLQEVRDDMITFSFDCQKNLVNPKVPDQIAYFSRQLYTYNFTIVQGSSKSKMSSENVFIYTWMEHEYKKGSNEVSSAVFHRLSQIDLTSYSVIRLCADGCGGQNRNSTMIGMCSYFLASIAPPNIETIELVFPIPGHSFLPPYRVFGRIEKILKRESTITDPETYIDIFKEHGTVVKLGRDCAVKNWKTSVAEYFKPVQSWHFKFSSAKRFLISRNQRGSTMVQGEPNYNSDDGAPRCILKKGKQLENVSPEEISLGVPVNPLKLANVKNLLNKHFGNEWHLREDLAFYELLVAGEHVEEETPQDEFCEVRPEAEEEVGLRI